MGEWVHCNVCFGRPVRGKKFSLTSCGHVYCNDCLESATKEKCTMCGMRCTAIQLAPKMKPDVELYFTEPKEIIKNYNTQLNKVMDFQKNHRLRLSAYVSEKATKQEGIISKAQKVIGELEREVKVLKEENAYMRKLVSSMRDNQDSRSSSMHRMMNHRKTPPPPGFCSRSSGLQRMAPSSSPTSSSPQSVKNSKQQYDRERYMAAVKENPNITSGRLTIRTPSPYGHRHGTISPGRLSFDTPRTHSPMNTSPCRSGVPQPPPVNIPMTPNYRTTPYRNTPSHTSQGYNTPGHTSQGYNTPGHTNQGYNTPGHTMPEHNMGTPQKPYQGICLPSSQATHGTSNSRGDHR